MKEGKYLDFKMAWLKKCNVLLALFTIIHQGRSVRIEECPMGIVTIVEGERTNITCSGISEEREMRWMIRSSNGELVVVGRCDMDNECSTENTDIILSRDGDRSSLSLLRNQRKYGKGDVLCEQDNWVTPDDRTGCSLTVISRAELGGCRQTLDATNWSLNVSCSLYKMFNSLGSYACYLVLDKQDVTYGNVDLFNYTDRESGLMYMNTTCTFTTRLPTENGSYKYYITSKPPLVSSPEYDLIITPPGHPNVSSCPMHVRETANVTCLCEVNSTGNPSANVSWAGQHESATLVVINVTRSDNDRHFTCVLSWGTYWEKASYRLRVSYGPETAEISRSTFWVENNVKFGNLTCNATGYSPGVTYVWNVPCQTEALVEHASVCSASFKDQQTDVTCTAANSQFPTISVTAMTTVYHEDTGLTGAIVGGALGIVGVVSLCAALASYIKRRKVSEFVDHINEVYVTSDEVISPELHNANQFEEHDGVNSKDQLTKNPPPRTSSSVLSNTNSSLESTQEGNTCSDMYEVPDKSKKISDRSSQPKVHPRGSAVIGPPTSQPAQRNTQTESQCLEELRGASQNISGSYCETRSTCGVNKASRLSENLPSEKPQAAFQKEEIQPQAENDDALYSRLDFSRTVCSSETSAEAEPVYNNFTDG